MSIRAPQDAVVDHRPVLHLEEVARARIFFRIILAIAALTAAFIPALAGERWLRLLAAMLCTVVASLCAAVLLTLRDPGRYTAGLSTAIGVVFSLFGVVVLYYIGLFSAGVMILVVGLYFFGTSHSRLTARATYATIAIAYFASSTALAAGWLADRALFSTAAAQPFTRWFQVVMSQVIFGLTFYLARSSRRAMEAALDRVTKANLQIQKQNALLAEARSDLARVTTTGTGRHTGQKIGPYLVGELLGRGAMGEVYRAEDRGGMTVALKLLHPALLESPTKVKRFLREAEAASAARSPHVPRVFGTGWTDDATTPWLAMELLEGHDLGWHLRKTGKLRLDLVVEMVEHVSRALADVREAGVVHRDLKPANLFLTDSLPRTWKVLDFGLSKILWESGSLTRDHAVGTPSYMSPEQIRGPTVDHLADLYALAAIAYRALTGIPPFAGDEVAHVLYRVLYQQPVCPGELVPVPIDMELVLAIGLAKAREERFERVEDLAAAMRAALDGKLPDDIRAKGWNLVKRMPWGSYSKPPEGDGKRPGAAA
jgi:serine/threonine-protein kinase